MSLSLGVFKNLCSSVKSVAKLYTEPPLALCLLSFFVAIISPAKTSCLRGNQISTNPVILSQKSSGACSPAGFTRIHLWLYPFRTFCAKGAKKNAQKRYSPAILDQKSTLFCANLQIFCEILQFLYFLLFFSPTPLRICLAFSPEKSAQFSIFQKSG